MVLYVGRTFENSPLVLLRFSSWSPESVVFLFQIMVNILAGKSQELNLADNVLKWVGIVSSLYSL
jgi:hypothetical protein